MTESRTRSARGRKGCLYIRTLGDVDGAVLERPLKNAACLSQDE